MTKEFKNLLELLKSKLKVNVDIGLLQAPNYESELQNHFGFGSEALKDFFKQAENSHRYNITGYLYPIALSYANKTYQIFCESAGLYQPEFSENEQSNHYKKLKEIIKNKIKPKYKDLNFLNKYLRHTIISHWLVVKHLKYE